VSISTVRPSVRPVFGLLLLILASSAVAGEPPAMGPTFFSPQMAPDGTLYLWESLDRDGSIWTTDREGGKLTYVAKGHSPSWVDDGTIKFVRSVDDGHQILEQSLYRLELDGGAAVHLAAGDNPDYKPVLMAPAQAAYPDRPLSGKVICIDPGHGSNTGAHSPHTDVFEDFYTLQSAGFVSDYLEMSGAAVRLTRLDNSTNPALSSRVNFSNSVGATLFNSIHYNSASNQAAHGLEVLHRSYVTTSKTQARKIHDRMVEATDLFSRGVKGDKEVLGFYLGVLSSSHNTDRKTLTEGAFLSNAEDSALVDDPVFNEKLSYGIYAGICDMLGVAPEPPVTSNVETLVDSFDGPLVRRWIGAPTEALRLQTPEGDSSAVVLTAQQRRCATLRTGGSVWADYRVTAVLRSLTEGPASYGVMARCGSFEGGRLTGLLLVVDEAGKASLVASMGNPHESVELGSLQLDGQLMAGMWHELTIACRGGVVTASVDGLPLETVQTSATVASVIRYGKAGLYVMAAEGPARVAVDRFTIEPIE